jgi:hypothetical protein
MEKMVIRVPEKKSKLIKSLLKELGAVIEPDLFKMSKKLNGMVKAGAKPSMDDIVKETRAARAKL